MIKNFKKLILLLAIGLFAFSFAESSFKTDIKAISEATLNNDDGRAFDDGGNDLDTLNINMTAKVDNVTANVKLEKGTVGGTAGVMKFSSAYLEVKDVLDGLLTFKFYDIGFAAGKGSVARADVGAHGIKVTIKPVDILSIAVGYGINNSQLRNDENNNRTTYLNSTNTSFNGDYHAISLDIGVNLDVLPFTIYAGALMADRTSERVYNITTTSGTTPVAEIRSSASKLLLVQAGLTMDVLAAIKPGALKIDFGAAFAGSQLNDLETAASNIADDSLTANDDGSYNIPTALAMAVILHGGVADLAPGFGLDYYFHFSPDSMTKASSLGDLDDDIFAEMIKVTLTPSYTLGQFKFSLGLGFKRYGEVMADKVKNYRKFENGADTGRIAVNALDVDPSITWTPATGMSVRFFYELDFVLGGSGITDGGTTLLSLTDDKDDIDHGLGMEIVLAVGVNSE